MNGREYFMMSSKKKNKLKGHGTTLEEMRLDHAIRRCNCYQITAAVHQPQEEEQQQNEGEMCYFLKKIFFWIG